MVLSRALRPISLLVGVALLAVVTYALWPDPSTSPGSTSPSNSKDAPESTSIVPGGGTETALAKELEENEFSSAARRPPLPPTERSQAAPTASPGASAGPSTPAGSPARSPASAETSVPRTGGEAESKPMFLDDIESGLESDPGKPSAQRWRRAKERPKFARIHIDAGNSLKLERMRITVTIEGARARTVVDHVFANPHDDQLEGTFEYPLPTSASPSYYAMFLTPEQQQVPAFFRDDKTKALPKGALATMEPAEICRKVDEEQWGELREARVVSREKALQTYEEITRREIDPALLEYASGNTFRGRVFPIQPKGLNRVIIAYEELLDVVEGKTQYRFALPDCKLDLLHVTIVVDKRTIRSAEISHDGALRRERGNQLAFDYAWEDEKAPGGDLILAVEPKDPRVQVTTGADPSGGGRSFYARVRPDLPADTVAGHADRAVFLLDTSFSEDPDRFNASLKILDQILSQDESIKLFNVMCFDAGAAWIDPKGWIPNDRAGRARVKRSLPDLLLEGATDLSAAVSLLDDSRWLAGSEEERVPSYVFLLTDGQVNWGEQDANALANSLDDCAWIESLVFCYRTGISAENLDLFRALTRRGGGIFNVFTEGMAEKVGLAHRHTAFLLENIRIDGAEDVLVAGRQAAVFPGGEIVLAGRYLTDAPKEIVLRGEFRGKPRTIRVPIELDNTGTLADRAWAELAVNQILSLDDQKLEPLATAYAQRYHIGSRVTSFLVLEKDDDYEDFDIAKEGSNLKVDSVSTYLDQRYAKRPKHESRKAAWRAFLDSRGGAIANGKATEVLDLLHDQDCTLPPGVDQGVILSRSVAGTTYLKTRKNEENRVQLFVDEAARRIAENRLSAGVKALSTIVETHPGRSDAMRLVGYRLMSMNQPGAAAQVFDRVRLRRPFEPHSFRDLARSLELAFRYPLAAVQYEVLLAGTWHDRFESMDVVVADEYVRLLDNGLRSGSLSGDLRTFFTKRRAELAKGKPETVDLRVTISWNTDNTDVDLWIVEPTGEACGYEHTKTRSGGELLDDLTSGYGPERYQISKAPPGEFVVLVKYYSSNPNLIAGETHVEVLVERRANNESAEIRRFQVILNEEGQAYEVCKIHM